MMMQVQRYTALCILVGISFGGHFCANQSETKLTKILSNVD